MSTQAKVSNAEPSKYPSREAALKLLKDAGADDSVIAHCKAVSELALKIADKSKEPVDKSLVEAGGLLHDIGRSVTHGITHAVEGVKIAKKLGLPTELVNIIERHIGAGLTEEDAVRLGLPKKSYLPSTLEEKTIAHADNLLSGAKRIPVSQTISKLVRQREMDGAKRMLALHKELSELCGIDLDQI